MTARGKSRHLFDWLISYTQGFVQFGNAREGQGYPAGLPALVIRAIGEDRGGQDGFLGMGEAQNCWPLSSDCLLAWPRS
ncbi:hypothetical protein [Neomoorella thermoacetica]|uniref:hypothetical protein n=1 Tax=Neomoorella thermoacetica TaxID=1525 RepID=UPI0008FBB960|nr:hypothetical protein [Moorella thermoacetica]OIQ54782.1 hypothetical protein MORE_11600 [Moorella thermoacetica]